jgi:bifunctional DNA-binding transcriptional regulator/antitoxin component of YhaV-PrlF toxin-antitoxin module
MGNTISTITSKWQVTIPEDVRKELPFKIGQRIIWEVHGDRLVGRRVRSLSELSGCLKPGAPITGGRNSPREFAKAALARHERIAKQKP